MDVIDRCGAVRAVGWRRGLPTVNGRMLISRPWPRCPPDVNVWYVKADVASGGGTRGHGFPFFGGPQRCLFTWAILGLAPPGDYRTYNYN